MCNKDLCRSTLSADMSTNSRWTCQPTGDGHVGRELVNMSVACQLTLMSADTLPYCTATQPILHHHSASSTLILSALDTEFYLLYSTVKIIFSSPLRGAFSGHCPLIFGLSVQKTSSMSFFQLCFFLIIAFV